MPNPNPRILVNRCYATSVYVGDIAAIGSFQEAQFFINGVADAVLEHFEETFISASYDRKAERAIFVFKKLDHAKQLEADWEKVVAYFQK
jgi:hypothetical protein